MSFEVDRSLICEKVMGEEFEPRHEDERPLSYDHNLTIAIDDEGALIARQINNGVALSGIGSYIADFARRQGLNYFNIPPSSMRLLEEKRLTCKDIISNPVPVVFISSYGLLNGSEWTSNQPSEGIAVLSEWLARNEPTSAPLFIDPNLIATEVFEQTLQKFVCPEKPSLVGFSLLPVNMRNDIPLIARTKQCLPRSVMVAGGIGSEILDLFPTLSGTRGISEALPIDAVLVGTPFGMLSQIIKGLYSDELTSKTTLDTTFTQENTETYPISEIQEARVQARNLFIPYEYADLVHRKSYKEANELTSNNENGNVVSVLIDNRCDQDCYFCSSPKQQIYDDVQSAMNYLEAKVRKAEVIAINDNDLSNNPGQTMTICQEMIARGMAQPKHGKMRVNSYKPELIDKLARANFVRLAIGVESFDHTVRRSLNKKDFTDDTIEKNLRHMLSAGIQPEINLILFSPHETSKSIEKTVRDSLKWVNEGCSLYVTVGLFAVPNAPAVKDMLQKGNLIESQLIETEELFYPGMKDSLLFPTHWKSSDESIALREELLVAQKEVLGLLSDKFGSRMSIPIEAYIAIALLANRFGFDGFSSKEELLINIFNYVEQQLNKQYVSI